MYAKYLKCICLLIICIGCTANTVKQSAHASSYRAPQLPPVVQNAVERSAEATSGTSDARHYHHQHYYIDGSSPKYHIDEQLLLAQRNQLLAEKRADTKPIATLPYKARVGEILAKDAIVYSNSKKAPVTRQYATIQLLQPAATAAATLRRSNLWPINMVDNTVTSLATKAAASANAVKNLLKIGIVSTFDNFNAAVEHKRQKIKSYLIQAAQKHKFALQQAAENDKYQQQQLQQHHHHQQLSARHQLGASQQQQYPLKSAITQQIPLTSHATAGSHHSPFLKSLHHLIPSKQQLTQNVVQHIAQNLKMPRTKKPTAPMIVYASKPKPLPTTTISEHYMHTYDNNYIPAQFFGGGQNPYAAMGVTSYKHFEDTILRELEEKEERKVEATMYTLLDDSSKYVTKPNISELTAEWSPNDSNDDLSASFFGTSSPATISNVGNYMQSTFDRPFNDVRPVCEHTDDIVVQPTLFVYPATAAESQINTQRQEAASNDNAVAVKPNATNQTNSTATEKPNYPAYLITQQQQSEKKIQQKLIGAQRAKRPVPIPNKTQQRNTYNFKFRNTIQRHSAPTSTTGEAIVITASSNGTAQLPITTTSSILFYTANGTDDGFQPINPPTELLRSSKSTKLSRHKFNGTITTLSSTVRPKTSAASVQAQASHVSMAIVSPPKAHSNTRSTSNSSHTKTTSHSTRKAPKKQTKPIKDSTNQTNSTNTANAYQNINKNQFRGSVKFSDSLHESP